MSTSCPCSASGTAPPLPIAWVCALTHHPPGGSSSAAAAMSDEEPVSPQGEVEESCKPQCVKAWLEYQASAARWGVLDPPAPHAQCTWGRGTTIAAQRARGAATGQAARAAAGGTPSSACLVLRKPRTCSSQHGVAGWDARFRGSQARPSCVTKPTGPPPVGCCCSLPWLATLPCGTSPAGMRGARGEG